MKQRQGHGNKEVVQMSSHFEPATKITKTFSGRQIIVGKEQSSGSFSRESLSSGQASMLSPSSSFPAHLQPAKPPNQLHPTQSTGSHESTNQHNHETNQPGQPVSLFKLGCRSWPRNPGLSPTQKKGLVAERGKRVRWPNLWHAVESVELVGV